MRAPNDRAGIGRIVGYVPTSRIEVVNLAPTFGVGQDFIAGKTGFRRLARKSPSEDTSDLAAAALDKLRSVDPDAVEKTQLLIVVTQNPDGFGLPHVSAKVAAMLGLRSDVAAFDMGLGCSGWVY